MSAKMTSGPWTAHTFEPEQNLEHYVTAGDHESLRVCRTGRFDLASAADARAIACLPELVDAARELTETLRGCAAFHEPKTLEAWRSIIRILARIDGETGGDK